MMDSSIAPVTMVSTTHPTTALELGSVTRADAASAAQLAVSLLVPLLRLSARLGLHIEHTLADVGLSQAELSNGDLRVSHAFVAQLLQPALSKRELPDLGLLAAREVLPEDLDILEYLARSQARLGDALAAIVQFRALLHDGLDAELSQLAQRAVLRVDFPGLPMSPSARELVLATLLLAARRMTGQAALAPLEVHFPHDPPADIGPRRELFGCPVLFGQPDLAMFFARDTLDTPLLATDLGLAGVLERHATARLQKLRKAVTMEERAKALLRQDVGIGRLTAENLARQLGMSSRTLHRRLAMRGCSYRDLLDSARHDVALQYLRDRSLAIKDIGARLGFTTGPAFQRAFKRWTGVTPSTFRALNEAAARKRD